MTEIIHKHINKITDIGNSKGIRLKKMYREIAGMQETGEEVEVALIDGKHGIFIGTWITEDQPEIDDIGQAELEKLLEKAKNGEEE